MKNNRYLLALASLLTISAVTYSTAIVAADADASTEEASSEDKSPWTSSVELGFISTTGNTENKTTAAKADVVYEVDKWRHTGHAEGYGQESEGDTGQTVSTAERYQVIGKSDYKFNEHNYAFGVIKLQKDRFSGFEYEHVASLGYGRKAIKQDNMELDLEIGPGERFFKVDNGQADKEVLLRLAGKYWWKITGTSKFTQDLTVEIGENITTTESITGVSANISDLLALKFTYTIRNKNTVPVGVKNTDTEAAMTLVYTF